MQGLWCDSVRDQLVLLRSLERRDNLNLKVVVSAFNVACDDLV